MFLADCHTHSLCSPDSNAPMLQMAQKAYEYGLHTLCLTDHCDLLSLEGERTLDYDWTPVHRERKGMLDAFGARLDLPMGLEFGMGHLFPRHLRKFSGSPGWILSSAPATTWTRRREDGTFICCPMTPWRTVIGLWTTTSSPCWPWPPAPAMMWWAM